MHKTHIPLREYNATLLLYPDGYVEIHPDDAKNLDVRDRWSVRVVSAGGDMEIMAKVSDEVAPGRAYIPYFIRDAWDADDAPGYAPKISVLSRCDRPS